MENMINLFKNKKGLMVILIFIFISLLTFMAIFSFYNNHFTPTGSLNIGYRSNITPALLNDGNVLIAGGFESNSAEIYNPKIGIFSLTGNMNFKREKYTATLLQDGRVLITGGTDNNVLKEVKDERLYAYTNYLSSAEIYDPITGKFTLIGNMHFPRGEHTATLLKDGRVLITGGEGLDKVHLKYNKNGIHNSAEIYDPKTGKFTLTGNMHLRRNRHTAVLLNDGRVAIIGGSNYSFERISSIEIYDPKTEKFTLAGNMKIKESKSSSLCYA